jgi:hypothetical protein
VAGHVKGEPEYFKKKKEVEEALKDLRAGGKGKPRERGNIA